MNILVRYPQYVEEAEWKVAEEAEHAARLESRLKFVLTAFLSMSLTIVFAALTLIGLLRMSG